MVLLLLVLLLILLVVLISPPEPASVRKAFSSFPTYMMWDDHELRDGWGSFRFSNKKNDEMDEIFAEWKKKGLNYKDCKELLRRMEEAGKQVYYEYQHKHNPKTNPNVFDYGFSMAKAAFYFLDGRGHRDINRSTQRILGIAQFNRFKDWINFLDPQKTKYLFVISAVPLLHLSPVLVNKDKNILADLADIQDDLRDSWEHKLHNAERKALLQVLFKAANKGIKVSVLSGDVHTAAVFRFKDDKTKKVIYQLTSSAITYNVPRLMGWILGNAVPDEGKSKDGYHFERIALYTDSNFSLIKVNPSIDEVIFQLYGRQKVSDPEGRSEDRSLTHSIAKIPLLF